MSVIFLPRFSIHQHQVEERRKDERLAANLIYNLVAVNSILTWIEIQLLSYRSESSFTSFNNYTSIVLIINIYIYFHDKRKRLSKGFTKALKYLLIYFIVHKIYLIADYLLSFVSRLAVILNIIS